MDVRILFIFMIPLTVVFGLLHGLFWLRWRRRASLWWTAADWLAAIAVTLILLPDKLPEVVTIPFAQTVIVALSLMLWQGFRSMTGRALPLRRFTIVTLVYFGLFYFVRSFTADIAFAFVLPYLALCAVNAAIAVDLARAPLPSQPLAYRILAVMFLCHALFYLFQSSTSFLIKPAAIFLGMGGLQSMTILVALFTASFWNLGAFWLTTHQRQPRRCQGHLSAPVNGAPCQQHATDKCP